MSKAILYTDGGARGNPGPAAIGGVLKIGDKEITFSDFIGVGTNNQAEYRALLRGLSLALENGVEHLYCYLDSELVVQQLNRKYKVKDAVLGQLFLKAWNLSQKFRLIQFSHVAREENKEADALVNQALDRETAN